MKTASTKVKGKVEDKLVMMARDYDLGGYERADDFKREHKGCSVRRYKRTVSADGVAIPVIVLIARARQHFTEEAP